MNKVYKVIWSEARNAYVVVSEMAKNMGGKSCSTKKLLAMLVATGVMTCAGVVPAMAANPAPEDTKIEVGKDASATGYDSTAIGHGAKASGTDSIAAGVDSSASAIWSIAVGDQANATAQNAVAVGHGTTATGLASIAIGSQAVASGADSIAIGNSVKADNMYSIAIGNDIKSTSYGGTAMGQQANATGEWSTAIGALTNVDSENLGRVAGVRSTAIGAYSAAWGNYSTATGMFAKAEGNLATANGYNSTASGAQATALGYKSKASHDYSMALGSWAATGDKFATAVGYASAANAYRSTAIGDYAQASAEKSTAIGASSAASGDYSIALGVLAKAEGEEAIAEGYESQASGIRAIALGRKAWATADYTTAVGGYASAVGELATAVGHSSSANVLGASVLGAMSEAAALSSTAIGFKAKGHAENSVALGSYSVADREKGDTGYGVPNYAEGDATWTATAGAVSVGGQITDSNKQHVHITRQITNVAAGRADTDAVNVAQLKAVEAKAGKHTILENGKNTTVESETTDGQLTYKVNVQGDLKDITSVQNGGSVVRLNNDSINISSGNKSFSITNAGIGMNYISSVDCSSKSVMIGENGTTISGGLDVAHSKITSVAKGDISSTSTDAINGSQLKETNDKVANIANRVTTIEGDVTDIKNDITRIDNSITEIRGDITEIKGDITELDDRVTNVETLAKQHTTVVGSDNVAVTEDKNATGGKEYTVALKKDITLDSVTTGDTVMNNDGIKVGDKVSVTKDAVTAGSTSISNDGLKVGDKTYVSSNGLNANSQKVTNVADGEISATSKDAVNGSQLHAASEQVINNSNRISKLGDRVNKVGAGAAALAALHPMDFDPDDKWSFSAGYGNYAGENAAAVGAYYRPDEKVMFSVGGTVGNGENMVNAGISFALDRTNHVSNSRTAMAREILDLRAEVAELKAMVAKGGLGSIDEDKLKLFPDVPENHWAYEYIAKLAGNGILEGYPDGKFDGDRMMSRYEFAAMLYRAMQNGAQLDSKIINEFAPEMGRIRVDRISGKDGDRSKIERVRVNGPKTERDHYGSKLAK